MPSNVLSIGLFFSRPAQKLAHALSAQLRQHIKNYQNFSGIQITSWDEGFFGRLNVSPLDEFFRKLHSLDGAIFLLTKEEMKSVHLNENVLLELGASIAKLGKARTMIVISESEAKNLPTYFQNKPLALYTYDESRETSELESIVGYTAKSILTALTNLGDSVFFSDLPSFGLASGYCFNFLKPLIEHLDRHASVLPSKATAEKFSMAEAEIVCSDYRIKIFVPSTAIILRHNLQNKIDSFGWGEFVLPVKDGRDINFFGNVHDYSRGIITVYEVPTNLRPSIEAIEHVERNWLISQVNDPDFQDLLARKEIRSFRRYLDIMVFGRKSPLSDAERERVEIIDVETIEQVDRA